MRQLCLLAEDKCSPGKSHRNWKDPVPTLRCLGMAAAAARAGAAPPQRFPSVLQRCSVTKAFVTYVTEFKREFFAHTFESVGRQACGRELH